MLPERSGFTIHCWFSEITEFWYRNEGLSLYLFTGQTPSNRSISWGMRMDQIKHYDVSSLPPFPEGWYFVGSRRAILKEKLTQKTWMGKKVVVWCDDKECICVAESACPHLGSELGPDAGGKIRNGCLVCPFHGYEYDATGRCVATPYAPPPKATQLRVFETREMDDLIFAWWGNDGRPSQWDLPEGPPMSADWSEIRYRIMRFPGHPQETSENSVDIAHLRHVHGYDSVHPVGEVSTDGPYLKSCFDFKRTRNIIGIKSIYDVSAITHVYGFGYSYVDIREHSIGMDARLWVLATPVDSELIEMVLAGQVRNLHKPKRFFAGLRFLPPEWRAKIMNQIVLTSQKRDVLQDVTIWGRKQYRPRPRLCQSDGEIGKYRRYCKQFYPDLEDYGQH